VLFFLLFVGASPAPDDLRTAHPRRVEDTGTTNFLVYALLSGTYLFGMTPLICREIKINNKNTRSHVLLHCPNARLVAARVETWEGKDPGGVRVLLSIPRWERRLLKFLECPE
jgi:hypothetical protein